MKKFVSVLLLLCLCASSQVSFAQDVPDDELPPSETRTKVNFFGGLLTETHLFNQELALNMGATMGVTYLDHFYLGGYYTALVSQHYRYDIQGFETQKLRSSFNHGGMIVGYVWKPQSLVNLNFSARAGWGSVWYFDPLQTNGDKLIEIYGGTRDRIFALTPQIECTVTPLTWLRIGLGFGYRVVLGLDRSKNTNADFDSPVGIITLSFGSFKNKGLPSQDTENATDPGP
jgi:hypothetical protein